MKFSGVMIGSDDPDRLGAFYTKVLGEPGWHDGTWYGWADGAQLMLGAHSDVHGSNPSPQRVILTVEAEDVETAFKEITALGAGIIAEPYRPEGAPGEVWLATVTDPDGNYVQLATPWVE
jgi:predicted enzyme related to lactoylglutathione lyase